MSPGGGLFGCGILAGGDHGGGAMAAEWWQILPPNSQGKGGKNSAPPGFPGEALSQVLYLSSCTILVSISRIYQTIARTVTTALGLGYFLNIVKKPLTGCTMPPAAARIL